jgi:hypothetical protein
MRTGRKQYMVACSTSRRRGISESGISESGATSNGLMIWPNGQRRVSPILGFIQGNIPNMD